MRKKKPRITAVATVKQTNKNNEETCYPQPSTLSIATKPRLEEKEKFPSGTKKPFARLVSTEVDVLTWRNLSCLS